MNASGSPIAVPRSLQPAMHDRVGPACNLAASTTRVQKQQRRRGRAAVPCVTGDGPAGSGRLPLETCADPHKESSLYASGCGTPHLVALQPDVRQPGGRAAGLIVWAAQALRQGCSRMTSVNEKADT